MRKILIPLIIAFFFCSLSFAEMIEKRTYELCNDIMNDIFNEIKDLKPQFSGLKDFDDDSLKENEYGILSIEYKENHSFERNENFKFGLTLTNIEDDYFKNRIDIFNYSFPLLNVKFTGYQETDRKNEEFNIIPFIQKYGKILLEEQNKKMPIRLTIEPEKEEFGIGEKVSFTIRVTNVSDKNLIVRELTDKSAYFKYRNAAWGSEKVDKKALSKVSKVALKPGESISKTFMGSDYKEAQEFEIFFSYFMTFQGVNPSTSAKIKIVNM